MNAGEVLVQLNSDFISKDMDIARLEMGEVEANLAREQSNQQRLKALIKTNATSRRAYDDALFAIRALEKKHAALEQRQARFQLSLDKSAVRTPYDGIILKRYLDVAEWTAPGSPVFRVASTADVVLKVALTEELIQYQELGTRVEVFFPALSETLQGVIDSVGPVADVRTKNVYLKLRIPFHPRMVQNMSGRVNLATGRKQTLHAVSRDALVSFGGKDFIFTVAEGKAQQMAVNVVTRSGPLVGIQGVGIASGIPVVVDGNDRLKPNQPVQVVNQ